MMMQVASRMSVCCRRVSFLNILLSLLSLYPYPRSFSPLTSYIIPSPVRLPLYLLHIIFDFKKQLYVNALHYRCFSITSNPVEAGGQISDTDKMRKRLYYQSKERGMLENDLLLGNFARKYLIM